MNIKKKCSILLLTACTGFMNVNATKNRFGDLENLAFLEMPDKFTMIRHRTIGNFAFGPLALFLTNNFSLIGKFTGTMSLNRSEMEKHFLINTGINVIVGAINFWLLSRAASCPDRNNNEYINTAAKVDFCGLIATSIGFGYYGYQCTEKTKEYKNAAYRFLELAKKDRSQEEKSEMSQLFKKFIVTKETPREDMYSFKSDSDNEKYQLIQDSNGNIDFRKVTA